MYSLETLRDAYIRLEPHADLSRGLWPLGLSHAWTEYQGVSASAHFIFLDIFQVYFICPIYISVIFFLNYACTEYQGVSVSPKTSVNLRFIGSVITT